MCTVLLPPGVNPVANYPSVTIHTTRSHMCYNSFLITNYHITSYKHFPKVCSVTAGGCQMQILKLCKDNIKNIKHKYRLLKKIKFKCMKEVRRRCRLRDVEAGGVLRRCSSTHSLSRHYTWLLNPTPRPLYWVGPSDFSNGLVETRNSCQCWEANGSPSALRPVT